MPSSLARKVEGVWFGWSNVSNEFDRPLRPVPKQPSAFCTCAGPGKRITRRMVVALANKSQQRFKQIREIRRRQLQLLGNKEHHKKTRYVAGNFSGKPNRIKTGINGPSIGGFQTSFGRDDGGNRYGIEREGIDGLLYQRPRISQLSTHAGAW